MAERDRSQGFGFVYVDIAALLANRHSFKEDFHSPIETQEATKVNFPKSESLTNSSSHRSAPQAEEAAPSQDTSQPVAKKSSSSVEQIRDNLDRLQSLHHKLHAMLAELNQISGRKKS